MRPPPEDPEFARRLSWTQSSLDLCLDMERNLSDSRFGSKSENNEIVYAFDESVFELFVGGLDEPPTGTVGDVYFDRRRSVGVFNVREWRAKPTLPPADERNRISLNRQSAILTTEWLFSNSLPAMNKRGYIYMSRGHLLELKTRWEKLSTYYYSLVRNTDLHAQERTAVRALLDDQARLALEHNGVSTTQEVDDYVSLQSGELRCDLDEFWRSLVAHSELDTASRTRSFWRYAFSRRLAKELSELRGIGPLAQLVRINASIAGRLRTLDHAGEVDIPPPKELPSSERQPFWEDRIAEEIERRARLGIRVARLGKAIRNDAATLALVQSLANTAVRQNRKDRRYVFVTADSFIIDVYRAWHCHSALNFEPFVIRPVRHFAPLLNVANMADGNADSTDEMREKRDIFPALQAAINPFLLTLNLLNRGGASKTVDPDEEGHDDTGRWPRETFALRLRRILQEYRRSSDPAVCFNETWLRNAIADRRFFSGSHFKPLEDAESVLLELSERGRQIERSAIGLGLPWLGAKLDGLKLVAEILEKLSDPDESALAAYIQDMVDDLGNANLDLQARSLNIADHLESVIESDTFGGLSLQRVPLTLDLTFEQKGRTHSVEAQAMAMVEQASSTQSARGRRSKRKRSFDIDLHESSLAGNGGHRLFALFACVALRLNKWELAHRYANEALYRVRKFAPDNRHDILEVQYLSALCSRFQIGAGVVRDGGGFDVTKDRSESAAKLLIDMIGDEEHLETFVQMRAASELVALLIFQGIWSAAAGSGALQEYPKFEPDEYLTLLDRAWVLTHALREAIFRGVLVEDSRNIQKDFLELTEQVITNAAAIFTLAHVVRHRTDDPRITTILQDSKMIAWLDDDEPSRPADHVYPPITAFYRYWYLRARGRNPETDLAHFSLDVGVDLTAQKLFQLGV